MKVRGENFCMGGSGARNLSESGSFYSGAPSQRGRGEREEEEGRINFSRSMSPTGYKIEELAQIRLNVASLDQFIAASCSLADENSAIKERVCEAAKEARSGALLIEHLRNLFSHQQAIEWHAGSHNTDSSHLFTYSNQLTLVRAAKSLAANVAKILFLTDSVVLQEPLSQQSDSSLEERANNNLELAERLDNVANYSHLLRSFGELAAELVDLGRRIQLSSGQQNNIHRWTPTASTLPSGEAQLPLTEPAHSCSSSELENDIQDLQSLFQVNRLIIDRFIILLLTASKCCLRPNESFQGLQVRRSVARQIRASIGIIMAIVKCSIFGRQAQWSEQEGAGAAQPERTPRLESGVSDLLSPNFADNKPVTSCEMSDSLAPRANQIDYRGAHYLSCRWSPVFSSSAGLSRRKENMGLGQEQQQACYAFEGHHNAHKLHTFHSLTGDFLLPAPAFQDGQTANLGPAYQTNKHQQWPPQIMNYFLESNSMSAHKAINRLQVLVGLLTQVADCKSLVETLNFTLESVELSAKKKVSVELDKENCVLMSKRKLSAALNTVFLGELNAVLEERAYEFTDCAYTRHEHRETIVLLLRCLRLQLNKLVKLIYRLCRRTPAAPALSLSQLRQLASQIGETCAELKCELQSIVIEQSDELDRCNAQLDLVRQLKQHCLVGDEAKTAMATLRFGEQAERLIELCRMLNQVAPTHKMCIATKTLGLWFRSNLGQLLALTRALAAAPYARGLKDCTWLYIQVWCSFYDDFCQLARQLAYVTHAHYNPERGRRVAAIRDQVFQRHQLELNRMEGGGQELLVTGDYPHTISVHPPAPPTTTDTCLVDLHSPLSDHLGLHHQHQHNRRLAQAASLQSLTALDRQALGSLAGSTDSPRSLDHYHGFGPNYHRQRVRHHNHQHPHLQPQFHEHLDSIDDWSETTGAGNSQWQLGADELANSQYCSWPHQPATSDSCCSSSTSTTTPAKYQPSMNPAEVAWNQAGGIMGSETRAGRSVTIDESSPQMYSDSDERRDSNVSCKRDDQTTEHGSAASADLQSASGAGNGGGLDGDKWSDSDADAIVRGARETAQMALSMYQFTRGEGELNTTQDLFTQAELFAEEANELYKEVRCFSYKVPSGDLKKQLLAQLATIPALVQQLQFIVKNPTVGKPATFAKVDGVIRETRTLMEAVNRVVTATLSCRQHYNMAAASMRKRTRTLSPSYRGDTGSLEFESHISGSGRQNSGSGAGAMAGGMGGRHGAASMSSEPDI